MFGKTTLVEGLL